MKKKWKKFIVIFLLLAAFLWSPFSRYGVSLAVMKVYSGIHQRESLMEEKGIDLWIPGGGVTEEKDWYPFVMTFNCGDGFSRFIGERDLKLTILYNFPAFDLWRGCSLLYDPQSPYYNGFYGAYLVTGKTESGESYGFTGDGSLDLEAVAQVPQYDFQRLVLGDMGILQSRLVFQWDITETEEQASYAGSSGWTRVEADLRVNGVLHERKEFHQSYLQYGSPAYDLEESGMKEFEPVDMKGRIYGKYFPEWETGIFFYILAGSEAVVDACDRQILSKSRIGAP